MKIIAANWKMNLSVAKSERLAGELLEAFKLFEAEFKQIHDTAKPRKASLEDSLKVILAPSYLFTASLAMRIEKAKVGHFVKLAVQDLHYEEEGAYTGKIAASMLEGLAVSYAIIGHSEQRQHFFETDDTVAKKIKQLRRSAGSAISIKIRPIFCIGEGLAQREDGSYKALLKRQLEKGLSLIDEPDIENVIIAYEPIWAIGTGLAAKASEAGETHAFIRETLITLFGEKIGRTPPLLYGGSVKAANVAMLLEQEFIDGVLVGGASLKKDEFINILRHALSEQN